MTNNVHLSILIASVPSRLKKAQKLYNRLVYLAGDYIQHVEILILTDNKQRSIGLKRQALQDIARGEYIASVDDDDSVSVDYFTEFQKAWDQMDHFTVDVITFKQKCILNGKVAFVTFDLDKKTHDQLQSDKNGNYLHLVRPPYQMCFWRRETVKDCKYPDTNYGEDAVWVDQAITKAKTQTQILKVLHVYKWDSELTEAK